MSGGNKPEWGPQWDPRASSQPRPRLSFGSEPDESPPRLVRLEGGIAPLAIPPDFRPPPSGLPRVLIEEPTDGWWNQAGAFGYRFTDHPPGEGEVIALTEQLHLPGPPAPWWVQWFRSPRDLENGGVANTNFELRGRITYGVGGGQNVMEVDVIQGIQLPIVCNSIKVDLLTYRPRNDQPYATYPVIAGAMFGKGAGSGSLPPTWTSPFFVTVPAPGPGLNELVPLAAFARSVILHTSVTDPTLLAGSFLNFGIGAGILKSLDLETCYELLTGESGVPIPAGTNYVVLSINPSVAVNYFALQYRLAL